MAQKKQKKGGKRDEPIADAYPDLKFQLKKSDNGRIQVSVREYGESTYLDIRHMYKDREGEWKPTPKGCAVPINLAEKLHKRLGKLIKKARDEEGLETSEE